MHVHVSSFTFQVSTDTVLIPGRNLRHPLIVRQAILPPAFSRFKSEIGNLQSRMR
jgi:hypothetical protein